MDITTKPTTEIDVVGWQNFSLNQSFGIKDGAIVPSYSFGLTKQTSVFIGDEQGVPTHQAGMNSGISGYPAQPDPKKVEAILASKDLGGATILEFLKAEFAKL